ncbi:hypothetical protein A2U01_0093203, partial [Trifolium medium]|nr:hypothetical protein [Trifolium medium]
QSSPAQNLNTGAGGGCEVDPDNVVLPAVVMAVVLLLLPELPVNPALSAGRRYDLEVAQLGLSHQCPPRWGHARGGREW